MTREKEKDLQAGYRKVKAFRKHKKKKKELAFKLMKKAREMKYDNYGKV